MSVVSSPKEVPASPPRTGPGGKRVHLPELLAPAGDWECVRAAVENGADAIYFGLDKFNARMRAHNFTESDLPVLMRFLHERGVKGYVTFNTLVFENEIPEAEQYLRTLIRSGVDAAIVQDVGMCRMIRMLSADFPIHVSTQMTVTSPGGIAFTRELGCNLVVLARECSLVEIEKIQAAQQFSGPALPLEVFVHGALCVAYSGQCLTSEALGGRSANRGECAQACRMPYELIADGARIDLGDRKYLLSPQDLASVELVPEFVRLGIASLKIEGRLKSPEYVANITRIYRRALDRLLPNRPDESQSEPDAEVYEMQMAFSRGLYTGWFRGTNNRELVHGRFGKKRGVYLGAVSQVLRDRVVLRLEGPLKPGDGVVFDDGKPEEHEEGGRVYEILPFASQSITAPGDPVAITFGTGAVDFRRVKPGQMVWKTSDPELERRLRQSFDGGTVRYTRPATIRVWGAEGVPLQISMTDSEQNTVHAQSSMPLQAAQNQPLTTERLRDQLGRLGGTPFHLRLLTNEVIGSVVLPVSELNRMRRAAVSALEQLRATPPRWQLINEPLIARCPDGDQTTAAPQVTVLVRTLPQLETVLGQGAEIVYCDFEDPKKYRAAVQLVRASGHPTQVFVAPPRIHKPGEEWILEQVRSSEPDGFLVRNYDHLTTFAGQRCVGDYSLNVANRFSAEYFMKRFRLEHLTASYDLNIIQLLALLRGAPPSWFEITLHQHMPMFHMEHCIFCAFLSNGKDYRDCGRPCDTRQVKLKDRVGAAHPVKADAGCRNTVYNSLAQTGADFVRSFLDAGVRRFRIEFLDEPPEHVGRTLDRYRRLLAGEISGQQLWRELKLVNQLGVTRGQLPG